MEQYDSQCLDRIKTALDSFLSTIDSLPGTLSDTIERVRTTVDTFEKTKDMQGNPL